MKLYVIIATVWNGENDSKEIVGIFDKETAAEVLKECNENVRIRTPYSPEYEIEEYFLNMR